MRIITNMPLFCYFLFNETKPVYNNIMEKDTQYIYSFDAIVPKNSKILILGSIPSVSSLEKRKFYGNEKNRFWNVLYYLLEQKPADLYYAEKIDFLHRHNIALWDVIKCCKREGSLDSNIKDEQPNDIKSLIKESGTINHVFFNGTKAKDVYKKYFEYQSDLQYTLLPSTSPIPRKNIRNIDDLIKAWSIVRDILQET